MPALTGCACPKADGPPRRGKRRQPAASLSADAFPPAQARAAAGGGSPGGSPGGHPEAGAGGAADAPLWSTRSCPQGLPAGGVGAPGEDSFPAWDEWRREGGAQEGTVSRQFIRMGRGPSAGTCVGERGPKTPRVELTRGKQASSVEQRRAP